MPGRDEVPEPVTVLVGAMADEGSVPVTEGRPTGAPVVGAVGEVA